MWDKAHQKKNYSIFYHQPSSLKQHKLLIEYIQKKTKNYLYHLVFQLNDLLVIFSSHEVTWILSFIYTLSSFIHNFFFLISSFINATLIKFALKIVYNTICCDWKYIFYNSSHAGFEFLRGMSRGALLSLSPVFVLFCLFFFYFIFIYKRN